MGKTFDKIDDILTNSNKAELIEKLSAVLEVEGSKVVIITGVPNKEKKGLDVEVWQTGHDYSYEELGFIQEGLNIIEYSNSEGEEGTG